MRRIGTLLIAVLVVLVPSISSAHKSSKLTVRQRVRSTNQTPDRSSANIKHTIINRRNQPVRGRCTAVIEGRWTNPTTLENRTYKEDWFLKIGKLFPGRKERASGTIFVEHPDIAADPASWQPAGVTVRTTHCHVRSVGGGGGGGGGNCHSSYPDFCIPPPPPDLDCADVNGSNFTVVGSDPHGFDADNDGVGCET
jgi:hypothetical protein